MLLQPAARPRRRQQRLNQRPLLVGQVRGVPPLSRRPATLMASTFMSPRLADQDRKTSQTRSRSLMRFLVLVVGVLVVVGDQGALGWGADLPVEPDRGVEGEQALHDARPQP